MPTKWLHCATHYTVLSISWLPSVMGSLTPTSGLAANSHLWVCSFGHFSSNWSRLHFPSNPFWNGDFHSRCSLHNAFGKEESRVRQKNLNCSVVATEVSASLWGPSGARRALQDQLRLMQAARTHGHLRGNSHWMQLPRQGLRCERSAVSPPARWEVSFSLCCLEADSQTSVLLGRSFDGVTGIWFWCFLRFLIIADILAPHLSPALNCRIVFLFSF